MPSGRRILLVEGQDDAHVMFHLLTSHGIGTRPANHYEPNRVTIQSSDGVERLIQGLRIRLRGLDAEQAVDRIGIVVDADADSADSATGETTGLLRRWQSIRDILAAAGYSDAPELPSATGTIVGSNQFELPRVGVWLMPDNQVSGKIEDFARLLVRDHDVLWAHAESSIRSIPVNHRLFNERDMIKAHVHTWLAWQQEPGKPVGQAITKGYLDAQSFQGQRFVSWIRSLFEL